MPADMALAMADVEQATKRGLTAVEAALKLLNKSNNKLLDRSRLYRSAAWAAATVLSNVVVSRWNNSSPA